VREREIEWNTLLGSRYQRVWVVCGGVAVPYVWTVCTDDPLRVDTSWPREQEWSDDELEWSDDEEWEWEEEDEEEEEEEEEETPPAQPSSSPWPLGGGKGGRRQAAADESYAKPAPRLSCGLAPQQQQQQPAAAFFSAPLEFADRCSVPVSPLLQ
jgi:hypothetical protein